MSKKHIKLLDKPAKNALTAQACVGATFIFGGLAMWRKKEKQYEQ